MFCKNCGTEIKESYKFCLSCGINLSSNSAPNNCEQKESIVLECKGSLSGGGVGKIVLTNKSIMWTKSRGANFLMGGVLSFLTKGDTSIKFDQILKADRYGSTGLQIYTNFGKLYKFGFKSAQDRNMAMQYIYKQL